MFWFSTLTGVATGVGSGGLCRLLTGGHVELGGVHGLAVEALDVPAGDVGPDGLLASPLEGEGAVVAISELAVLPAVVVDQDDRVGRATALNIFCDR